MKLVVTGLDATGRSCVARRTEVDPQPAADAGYHSQPVYDGPASGETGPSPAGAPGGGTARFHDPGIRGGAAWRAVRYAPHGATDMHRTPTVDYDLVLEGTLTLELESGEVGLAAGDMVVMNGVAHRWKAGSDGCLLTALMIPVVR